MRLWPETLTHPAHVHTRMKPQGTPVTKLKFIEPMYARLFNELPAGNDWLYEVKFDGYYSLWIVSLIGSIFTDELLAT